MLPYNMVLFRGAGRCTYPLKLAGNFLAVPQLNALRKSVKYAVDGKKNKQNKKTSQKFNLVTLCCSHLNRLVCVDPGCHQKYDEFSQDCTVFGYPGRFPELTQLRSLAPGCQFSQAYKWF